MEDNLIVVMGATGSGKSSLIKLATGDSNVTVGHSLKSETKSITSHSFMVNEKQITLIDTPGFNDTYLTDREVLESVSKWLTTSYRNKVNITAILYVYNISDPRMQGSALHNFRIFRELCGEDCFHRITLCTTFWDLFKGKLAVPRARLEELKSPDFWGGMIEKGAKLRKRPNSEAQARSFFHSLTEPRPLVMKIQREMVDEGKNLDKTAAMLSFLDLELQRQREEHEQTMRDEKAKWEKEMSARNAQRDKELEEMRKRFEAELEKQRAATQEAEANIRRRMSEQASQKTELLKQMEQLRLRRAKTDLEVTVQEASVERQQRFDQFNKNVVQTINLLQTGVKNQKVKCGWNNVKQCYNMVCSHCLKSVGAREYYECIPCSRTKLFVLCNQCHLDGNITCNSAAHDDKAMVKKTVPGSQIGCPRANAPPQDRVLRCNKCKQNCGIVYFHCCLCDHSFDMCVNCALRGRYCPGHGRSFPRTAHVPELCSRMLP